MNEEEIELGKIAYQTYYRKLGLSPELWPNEPIEIKQTWIAVGRAVAERVIAELRTAEEASE